MKSSLLTLIIKRFHKDKKPRQWFEAFQVEIKKGMNLLEALLRIQDEQDGTLCFRYSCRGAVCGSCSMRVNGKDVLACRTHVEDLLGKPALIEPLARNLAPIGGVSILFALVGAADIYGRFRGQRLPLVT